MALPWLESLTVWGDEPPGERAASEAPVRLAVLFSGNGFHSKEWWAKGEGKSMELGKVLAPLADFREKMLFIRGLYNERGAEGEHPQLADRQPALRRAAGLRRRDPLRHQHRPVARADATADRRRCRAWCWAARSRTRRSTRTTRCSTARTFRGARRRRRRRWSSIPRSPSTACSRTRCSGATRACSTPCWPTPATCAARSARPTSASSTSTSTRCARSSSGSSRPASRASCKAGGRRSTSRTSRARPTASRRTSPSTCG